eukprot:11951363-Ditylum_brightwellii.AAC.1
MASTYLEEGLTDVNMTSPLVVIGRPRKKELILLQFVSGNRTMSGVELATKKIEALKYCAKLSEAHAMRTFVNA